MDIAGINLFDILILAIIGISTLLAFFNGLIRTVFSLFNWVGSLLITFFAYPYVNAILANSFLNVIVATIVSSIGVFIVSFIVFVLFSNFIQHFLQKLLRTFRLGVLDNTLGFAFGLARGILIACLIFFTITLVSATLSGNKNDTPEWLKTAKTYNLLNLATQGIIKTAPGVNDSIQQLADVLPENFSNISLMPSMPESLKTPDKNLLSKIADSLPESTMKELRDKYSSDNLSELEKMAAFREMLNSYQSLSAAGTIQNTIPQSDMESLLNTLHSNTNGTSEDSDVGYKQHQRDQFERLIDTVE